MRLGFCTEFSEEMVKLAKEEGFDCLEIFTGGKFHPARTSDDDVKKAKDLLDRYGIIAATVFHGDNWVDKGEPALADFRRAMDFAKILGTNIVTCNAWVPPGKLDEQLPAYKKVFSQFAEWAEDAGVKVAIENCPHGLHNIAFSPVAWEQMFDAVPSKAIGLEFDPSHLVFQGIDYVAAIYEFADRIYAFHAKDTEILYRKLSRQGNLVGGWWRFRVPGWGDVNWQKIFIALNDIGYNADVIIEHEDRVFSKERFAEGLRLGLRFLKQFIP